MEPDEGGSRSSSSRGVDWPARVIELERCAGVQVGRENDQFSAYRVTLPRAAFRSSEALAETLLSRDAPWSRDRFIHDARPDPRSVAGRGDRSSSSGIIEDPRGDTLVIVRDSRGVQIGDRNRQRNKFRIRVSDTAVRADTVGMTRERERYISRLHEDPRDRTAARRLAENLERAARTELMADLTARVRHLIGKPEISRWSGKYADGSAKCPKAGFDRGNPRGHVGDGLPACESEPGAPPPHVYGRGHYFGADEADCPRDVWPGRELAFYSDLRAPASVAPPRHGEKHSADGERQR